MAPGHILIARLPPLLRDLVRRLAGERAIESGPLPDASDAALIDAAVQAGVQVLVTAFARPEDAARASRLLNARLPSAALIDLDLRGRSATRFVAGVSEARVDALSPTSLRTLLGESETAEA